MNDEMNFEKSKINKNFYKKNKVCFSIFNLYS